MGMAQMIDASVHQQLGTLIAEVKNLREDFRRSEDKSDANRASLLQRMDELAERVGALEGTTAAVQEYISEMRPVTEDVRKWKLMGMGALGVIGVGGAAICVTFADTLKRLLMILRGG